VKLPFMAAFCVFTSCNVRKRAIRHAARQQVNNGAPRGAKTNGGRGASVLRCSARSDNSHAGATP